MKSYKVTITKTIEVDDYNDGCLPDTFRDLGVFYTFQSSDLELTVERIKRHVDLDKCEEFENRLEFSTLETDNGEHPSVDCYEAWKKGDIKRFNTQMWLATYSVYLESIETTELNANILKGVK